MPPQVGDTNILERIDYDLHNQIAYRPYRTLWGDAEGGAKVRFFHPGRYFKEPVRLTRSRRHGPPHPLRDRALRHARRPPGSRGSRRGLRRLPGDGPGREERLDGGARGLLLPHLGLFRAVRPFGARARHRFGRPRAGGVPPLHPVLAGARRRGRARDEMRCSRARARPAPTASPPCGAEACIRTWRRVSSCAATWSGWGSRR